MCFVFTLFRGRNNNFAKHKGIFSWGSGWNHLHEKIVVQLVTLRNTKGFSREEVAEITCTKNSTNYEMCVGNSLARTFFLWDSYETCSQLFCESSVAGFRLAIEDSREGHKRKVTRHVHNTKIHEMRSMCRGFSYYFTKQILVFHLACFAVEVVTLRNTKALSCEEVNEITCTGK